MIKFLLSFLISMALFLFIFPSCSKEEAEVPVPVVKPEPTPQPKKQEPPKAPAKRKMLVKNKKGWKVFNVNSSMPDSRPWKAIDGKPKTFWHTEWKPKKPKHPHRLCVDFGKELEIHGFSYLTRQDKTINGTINEFEFYVSNDKKKWGEPVASGIFEDILYDKGLQVIYFDKMVKGRYIKLVSKSEVQGLPYACCAEINVVVEQ